MKIWKPLALGITLAAVATATFVPMLRNAAGARSVVPLSLDDVAATPVFDRAHSAALFVGVRTFGDGTPEVPYAVDDAIDLAHVFALDDRVQLVDAHNVVLALSGDAVKPESRERLRELCEAGARVVTTERILALLEQQAAFAGRNGLLIVSFATHGFVRGGIPFVLSANGAPVSTATMLDVIADHNVPRSLIFVDACRTRVTGGGRGFNVARATALGQKMPRIHGQVMLAAVGEAYDDPMRRNGVFTAAVIDGLDCNASTPRGDVTPETLAHYVDQEAHRWIVKNKNPRVESVIQQVIDSEARNMPLARCWAEKLELRLLHENSIVTALQGARRLWSRDVGAPIVGSGVADLSAIVGTPTGIIAFNGEGREVWKSAMKLRSVATGDLFRKHHDDIVALTGSRISVFSSQGRLITTYDHTDTIDHVAICRPTTHYTPRVVFTSANSVFLLMPKKRTLGNPVWSGRLVPSQAIARIDSYDYDRDAKADIVISTAAGKKLILDIKGRVLHRSDGIDFERNHRGRKPSTSGRDAIPSHR